MSFVLAGERIGDCIVEDVVGRGATGVVYRARRAQGDRVALKLADEDLPAPIAEELHERYRREVGIGLLLDHPAIAAASGGGTWLRRPYVVLRLVPGEPLSRVLAASGRLPEAQARSVAAAVARALAHAHARKVIHRDVKPGNVLLARAPSAPGSPPGVGAVADVAGVALIDFGLARAAGGSKVTRVGVPLGAMGFAAPEALRGIDAGPPTDLFALGAVLYTMLTGRRPFAGQTLEEYDASLSGPDPARASEVAGTGPDLDDVIASCFVREPRERARDAGAIAARLCPDASAA